MEIRDLWISRAIAGRPKDIEFCRALMTAGRVQPKMLLSLLEAVPDLDGRVRDAVKARIES